MIDVQLRSIRRLPGLKQLSPDGITCGASADDVHLNVTLEKADWPERVLLSVPLRHLRRGDQDVSLAADRLGYVSLAVHVPGGPIRNGLHAAQEARKKEAEETARREADEKAAREAAEAKRVAAERARREAEEKAKAEAYAAEAEAARKRREAEEKARREAEEKAQREAEEKARREAEEAERREAERQLLEEQERVRRVREADERAAREAAEREQREAERVRREAEEKAREEAERLRREEAEEKARAKAEEEEKARQLEAVPMQKTSSEAELFELVGEKTAGAEEAADDADNEGEEEEGEEEEEEEGEEEEEEDAGPLAELEGDSQLGCTMSVSVPEENLPTTMSEKLSFEWHRSADTESWEPIDGSDAARFLVTADEVGCWVFAKWMVLDGGGAVLREGSTEMSSSYAASGARPVSLPFPPLSARSASQRLADSPLCCARSRPDHPPRPTRLTPPHRTAPHRTAPHRTAPHRTAPHRTAPHRPVRLLPEDREDLKAVVLKGELLTELKSPEGRATLRVAGDGVRLSHRFGGNEVVPLDAGVLSADRTDPTALRLLRPADAEKAAADGGAAAGVRCVCDAPQQRDLLVLAAKAFLAMGGDPQQEGPCQVWEGEDYADYYGVLHGQVRAPRCSPRRPRVPRTPTRTHRSRRDTTPRAGAAAIRPERRAA